MVFERALMFQVLVATATSRSARILNTTLNPVIMYFFDLAHLFTQSQVIHKLRLALAETISLSGTEFLSTVNTFFAPSIGMRHTPSFYPIHVRS
jgi:hypothetical protein